MAYGSVHGQSTDKLAEHPIPLQKMEGTDIAFPKDCPLAFFVSLERTVTAGDHNLYVCKIDKVVGDETKQALFAWDGYAKTAPARKG